MVRWSLFLSSALATVALVVPARAQLTINSTGTLGASSSTAYIEVNGTDANGQPAQRRCEPNAGCNLIGLTSISSGLHYDNSREQLISCNNLPATTGPCTGAGLVKAVLNLRVGQIKITAVPAPGYAGLLLSTSAGEAVRLEFAESAVDAWTYTYAKDFGGKPKFFTMGAGNYKVFADPLPAHCAPVQTNPGMAVSVTEGGQTDLDILFTATECSVLVKRVSNSPGAAGTVISTPSGLSCGAAATSDCTGKFPYDTKLTLTPVPDPGTGYSWQSGYGCIPTNGPCTKTVRFDSKGFVLNFSTASSPADAGYDASTPLDAAAPVDAGTDASTSVDASTTPAEGDAAAPVPSGGGGSGGSNEPKRDDGGLELGTPPPSSGTNGSSDGGCSSTGAVLGDAKPWIAIALPLLALLAIVRRRKR